MNIEGRRGKEREKEERERERERERNEASGRRWRERGNVNPEETEGI